MICKFCSQWNPGQERYCIFCANALDGSEDVTIKGEAVELCSPNPPSPVAATAFKRKSARRSHRNSDDHEGLVFIFDRLGLPFSTLSRRGKQIAIGVVLSIVFLIFGFIFKVIFNSVIN